MPKKGKCLVPDCWEDERSAGYCKACYSAMRRIQGLTVMQLSHYTRRIHRFASRLNMRGRVLKFKKRSAA